MEKKRSGENRQARWRRTMVTYERERVGK